MSKRDIYGTYIDRVFGLVENPNFNDAADLIDDLMPVVIGHKLRWEYMSFAFLAGLMFGALLTFALVGK